MFSLYGDESSSSRHATYGLLAVANDHLDLLVKIVDEAKLALGGAGPEPLHAKVLFHGDKRLKSSYRNSTRGAVESAITHLFRQICLLEIGFYLGCVEREKAPKIMHVPLLSSAKDGEVTESRLKLELPHLQFFAYGAAATPARGMLPGPPSCIIVDQNKSVVRWFNENRQASRMLELMGADATLPGWPSVTFADDAAHPGLQVVDLLTYYGTRQFFDRRFSDAFDSVRHKTHISNFKFAAQTYNPFVPPAGA